MKEKTSNKPIIVVLGMHRSGTSLTARALQVLGVDLGEHLYPPINDDNDKGFWEDIDINEFDNALLEKMGSAWDRLALLDENKLRDNLVAEREAAATMLEGKLKSTGLFGFKDPRTAVLLPFWQKVFSELDLDARYLIVVRNPVSVARSLLRRNNMPLEAGILLWAKYMSGMLRYTQGKRRVVVDYDLMLESPSHQIRRIANALSLPFDEHSQKRLDLFETDFISRDLRHHTASIAELGSSEFVPAIVKEAYAWMLKLAKDEIEFSNAELESFWQRFEEVCRSFNASYQFMDRLRLSLLQQQNENIQLSDKMPVEQQNCMAAEEVRDRVLGEVESLRQQLVQTSDELVVARKKQQELESQYREMLVELNDSRKLQGEYHSLYQHAIEERDDRQKSYEELRSAHKQAIAEKVVAQNQVAEFLSSNSWLLTRSLRAIRFYLIKWPAKVLRQYLSALR